MATINITVEDHSIRVDNLIELAQGSNNFDTCAFSFDSTWDGFTLYAVMYQNPKNVFKLPLDEANTRKIPVEVLQKDGWVYIGARGEKEDTDKTIATSMVVRLPVRKGAVNGNEIGQEMLDQSQYEYLLGKVNELNEKCESLTKELENDFSQLSEEIADLQQNGTGTGTGLTDEAKTALLNCFKNVAWTVSNGQDYYNALETALNASGSSGDDSGSGDSGDSGDTGETEVTLSSISAAYTGGDVAVGTALTSLTGITVTATYSDGSTANVTDYTLSGTIAEGSNTITVSYGGKTTTFTVTGVAEVTYVELTNSADLWEVGGVQPPGTGSTSTIRLRTVATLPYEVKKISVDDGYSYILVVYSEAQTEVPTDTNTVSLTGKGYYNPNGISGNVSAADAFLVSIGTYFNGELLISEVRANINSMYGNTNGDAAHFRILLKNNDDATLTADDGLHIHLWG